jgi:hypothetical protein
MAVKKRCDRCGHVSLVKVRDRRCRQRRFGRGSYACWGLLSLVKRKKKEAVVGSTSPLVTDGSLDFGQLAPAKRKLSSQEQAAKKLTHARKMIGEKTKALRRLATSLRLWERRAAYYAKRASMTDAEVAAEKVKREQATAARRQKAQRRAIKVGGLK